MNKSIVNVEPEWNGDRYVRKVRGAVLTPNEENIAADIPQIVSRTLREFSPRDILRVTIEKVGEVPEVALPTEPGIYQSVDKPAYVFRRLADWYDNPWEDMTQLLASYRRLRDDQMWQYAPLVRLLPES